MQGESGNNIKYGTRPNGTNRRFRNALQVKTFKISLKINIRNSGS